SSPVPRTPSVSFTPGPVSGLPHSQVESSSSSVFSDSSILLGISTREGEHLESDGIFQGSLNGQEWQALAEAGFTLLDYSEFGALVMQDNSLYVLKDNQRTLLTSQLRSDGSRPAVWLSDGHVAAILRVNEQYQITILSPNGGDPFILPAVPNPPLELYPSRNPAHVYWGAGTCANSVCETQEFFVSDLDGSNIQALPYEGEPAFAADGKMAFMTYDANHKTQLTLVNRDKTRTFSVPGNRLVDMSWSPDGATLAVSTSLVSNYSGRTLESRLFFVTLPATVDAVFYAADEAAEQQVWSPDGKYIMFVHRRIANNKYQLNFVFLDAARQIELPASGFRLVSEDYLLLQPNFWLP
ncbi:MAG: TolB family protein, partial [Anaerolineales bacterium]